MCEPNVSVVQYPGDDDKTGEGNETKIKRGLGPYLQGLVKRVKEYFHLAHLGSGHSESVTWAECVASL